LQAIWSHSSVVAKSSIDRQGIRVFEMFNDHEEHEAPSSKRAMRAVGWRRNGKLRG
jgi:hypothetical protein